jgi:Uma2 family endonuclease
MSSLAHSLVSWLEFLRLPERPEAAKRYELHDGEVVLVPPARPLHIKSQKRIERLLEAVAGELGVVAVEFPYRPMVNLQFWFADVAYIPRAEWDALPADDYPTYAPPLVVEVLSPSNTPAKVNRQRIIALSSGTGEFWVVDATARSVQVTDQEGTREYSAAERIPLTLLGGTLAVSEIFAV